MITITRRQMVHLLVLVLRCFEVTFRLSRNETNLRLNQLIPDALSDQRPVRLVPDDDFGCHTVGFRVLLPIG